MHAQQPFHFPNHKREFLNEDFRRKITYKEALCRQLLDPFVFEKKKKLISNERKKGNEKKKEKPLVLLLAYPYTMLSQGQVV